MHFERAQKVETCPFADDDPLYVHPIPRMLWVGGDERSFLFVLSLTLSPRKHEKGYLGYCFPFILAPLCFFTPLFLEVGQCASAKNSKLEHREINIWPGEFAIRRGLPREGVRVKKFP